MAYRLLVFLGFGAVGLMGAILVRPFFKDANPIRITLDKFSRLGWVNKIAVLFVVVQLTMFGGAKHGGTNDVDDVTGTNEVEIVEGGTNGVGDVAWTNDVGGASGTNGLDGLAGAMPPQLMMLGSFVPDFQDVGVTADDAARGYRLESVSTNPAIAYAMPSDGAAIRCSWHLTGAYEDVQKVSLDGFAFPLGSDLCTSLWAYTWGKVRPQLKNASNEIAAVSAPMSAIPEVSHFWTAATSNDTYLLTWENFAAGRVPTTDYQLSSTNYQLLSAQLELRCNGDFITRSNEVEMVYRRVDPEDWDGDGWRNDDDPDPYSWDEFYDDFCQELPEGANEDAYCWIEVRPRWNSDIWFYGDAPSNLDDPYIYGKAGETYRVQLLIGKTYFIESAQPLDVVGQSDSSIEVEGDGTSELEVVWPVRMSALESNGRGFRMVVRPSGLGGLFGWTDSCCTIYGSDQVFRYGCDGGCGCSGCYAHGYYEYEGYRLETTGGWCGCSPDDDDPCEDPDDQPPVGVSVSFSNRAIIFEDSYANTTNDIVPWNSTATELTCTINGGPNGGSVQIDISGDDNLVQYTGQTLPYYRSVAPNERIEFTNRYKATVESSREDDIEVSATFVENETGWVDQSEAKATAVRVEVEPATAKPGCDNRHVLGVGEVLRLFVFPSSMSADITAESGWTRNARGGDLRFICPLSNSSNGLTVNVGGDSYVPSLQVFKPQSIVCRVGRVVDFGFPIGTASGIGMQIEPIIEPESVAFTGIRMMERPTLVGASPPSGYFAADRYSDFWAHTTDRGAGVWRDPNAENLFFLDTASFGEPCPSPWSEGTIDWDIEIGWGDKDAVSLVDVIEDIPMRYHQISSISSDGGVKVEKFGQWVKRLPSGGITHSSGIRD